MADVTVIGHATRIRGRVSGSVDLELQGHLEGEVTLGGDLTVAETGTMAANATARRIVVHGAVKGDLVGEESIVLEDGARVVGDLRAPRVAIAQGALVRGHVQTGNVEGSTATRTRATSAGASTAASSATSASPRADASRGAVRPVAPVAAPARTAPVAPISKPTMTRTPIAAAVRPADDHSSRTNGTSMRAGGAPPPVVPALKKGAKGTLQKKRG